MSDTPRYEVQRIAGRQSALHDEVVNFRVTDKTTDSRIATCYDEENANFIVSALNELAATLKAKEGAERDVEQLKQSISLALTQMALAHKYPPEAAKETLESAIEAIAMRKAYRAMTRELLKELE